MTQALTFREFQQLAKGAKRVAVFKEIPAAQLSPTLLYQRLSRFYAAEGMMLEDLQPSTSPRYSFLSFEPLAALQLQPQEDPKTALRRFQTQFAYATRADVAEYISSIMGFVSYDAVRCFEDIPDRHPQDLALPTMLFHAYALNLSFDHDQRRILICLIVAVGNDAEQSYAQAQDKLNRLIDLFADDLEEPARPLPKKPAQAVEAEPSDAEFTLAVPQAKEHIARGDAFQIVLSRCFKRPYSQPPFEIYKTLRRVSPAPFMVYLPTKGGVILGA